jgi:hypothetical protein
MNNGSTGTGISIIFYLVLALLMPFVFLFRLARKNRHFKWRFVFVHFSFAALIAVTILIGVSYMTTAAGLRGRGEWHTILSVGARFTAFLLLLWAIAPLLVRAWLRLTRGAAHQAQLSRSTENQIKRRNVRSRYLVIDGVMSRNRWSRISRQLYSKPD